VNEYYENKVVVVTGALRYELWDENIRLSNFIPGTVDTPIWRKAGGAPDSAISAEQALAGFSKGWPQTRES
jgi:NAD(P)-dependent dehydrogenase (short-subunit alcohol dehydrogenase family)